jgi:plastocyanin
MYSQCRFGVVALSVVVVAMAGGGVAGAARPQTTEPEAAGAQTFDVTIDGRSDDFNGSFLGYYPSHLEAHPGDTIVFDSVFTGEPHTITFGSLVQSAVEGFYALTPEQQSGEEPPPAELEAAMAAIPPMLPDGPGDAIQSSVNPCFVAAGGEVPTDPAAMCDVTTVSPFTGTEVFYNSGFLPDGATFEMPLADDLAPGTYYGLCTLHLVEMIFTLDVVAADAAVATPDEAAAVGGEEFDADVAEGQAALDAATAMVAEMPGQVIAGAGSDESNVMVNQFFPADLTVAVGDPVTFTMMGPHTVSMNIPASARTLLAQGDDGGFHINPEGLTPAGFEMPGGPPATSTPEASIAHETTTPAATAPPATEATGTETAGSTPAGSAPPSEQGPPPPIDAGTWNGEGFFNSGLMFGGDFIVRFSKPGTYTYECLIHPGMAGTITVTS